jgi:hypothetical protein
MILDSPYPTRSECEKLAFELDFSEMVTAAMVEIALKSQTTPWMQTPGEA